MKIIPYDLLGKPYHSGHRGWLGNNPRITICKSCEDFEFIWYCAWGDGQDILNDMDACRKLGRCIFNITGDCCYVPEDNDNNYYFITTPNPKSLAQQFQVPYSYHASMDWIHKAHPNPERRPFLANFQGSFQTRPERKRLLDMRKSDIWIRECDGWQAANEKKWHVIGEHDFILNHSIFTLCPRGIGMSSIRLVEAMFRGSLPALLDDDSKLFGQEMEFCVRFPLMGDLNALEEQLRMIYDNPYELKERRDSMNRFVNDFLLIDSKNGCTGTIGYSEFIRQKVNP